jgi:hypothetical protein
MSNREKLEEAKILNPDEPLTAEQEQAIENLTEEEVAALISAKYKLAEGFPDEGMVILPCQHHH